MRILSTSDLHGRLPKISQEFDLLLIAGDVCPVENHGRTFQEEWVNCEFAEWVNSLPFNTPWSKVVMVPGNHDFIFEKYSKKDCEEIENKCNGRLVILRHEPYEFEYPVSDGTDSLKIFGTPYCSVFGSWPFMIPDDKLDEKFSEIPEDVDIIISHDSPNVYGLGDITQGYRKKTGTGNRVLYKHIKRVHPKLFICGHFHTGNHDLVCDDGIFMANVSYIDESYEPYWPVFEIEYDEEKRRMIGK